jgi:GMP synthase (glutamine-hydrolysing)
MLGICYGMRTMAVQPGGEVSWRDTRESGHAEVRARGDNPLPDGIAGFSSAEGHGMLKVWMSHGKPEFVRQ